MPTLVVADRRLPTAALVVHVLLVLRITQWPRLADPSALDHLERLLLWAHARGLPRAVDVAVVEALANVVMFVPFGVLLPIVLRSRAWVAVPAGAAFSTLIELGQLAFFPDRVATPQDVLMNTLGAGLGAALLRAWVEVRRTRLDTVTRPPERRPGLLEPSRLEPLDLDLRRIFLAGLGLWLVALAVSAALTLSGRLSGHAVEICVAGVGLGLLALLWERHHRRGTPASPPPDGTAAPD